MTAPAQAAGGGIPILGPLSPVARVAVVVTVAVALVGDRPRLRRPRRPDARLRHRRGGDPRPRVGRRALDRAARGDHRAAGRRHPQRDVRQHRRADHRVLRPAGRPDRRRQGVDHRLDHRQPAARAGRERARRRAAERGPAVQPRRSPARTRHCSSSPPVGLFIPAVFAASTARPDARATLVEESVLVALVLMAGYVLSLVYAVHESGRDPRRPRTEPRATAGRPGRAASRSSSCSARRRCWRSSPRSSSGRSSRSSRRSASRSSSSA